jgi:hypothetical protein
MFRARDAVEYLLHGALFCGAGFALASVTPQIKPRPQQLVYQSQATLPNGERVGIFLPAKPVALGLQSKSGSRVLVVGDILHCAPFFETEQFGDRGVTTEMMNCGPRVAGEPDRILAIAGIQWGE